jgi:hypothetical protein
MGFLDWMEQGNGREGSSERQSIPNYGPNEVAFRFQKPFRHLEGFMSPQERRVVEGIEARWKEFYEKFENYPPTSEGQEHETKVFRAVDDAYRALDAREHGEFKDWKRLEADVDKAMGRVREGFTEQRKYVEREVAEMNEYERKLSPDYRPGTDTHEPDR